MYLNARIWSAVCLLLALGAIRAQVPTRPGPAVFLVLSTNYPADLPGVIVETGIIRYFGKKNSRPPLDIPEKATDWQDLEDRLRKVGVADLLYYSSRELFSYPEASATFDAYEHRPPLMLSAAPLKLPYNTFGLNLKVTAVAELDGSQDLNLSWAGSYSWSTNFISRKQWEKVLLFVMKAGSAAGAGFYEEDHRNTTGVPKPAGTIELNLFRRAKAKQPEPAAPLQEEKPNFKLHYLGASRVEVPLAGTLRLAPNRFASQYLASTTGSPEAFFFVIRYHYLR